MAAATVKGPPSPLSNSNSNSSTFFNRSLIINGGLLALLWRTRFIPNSSLLTTSSSSTRTTLTFTASLSQPSSSASFTAATCRPYRATASAAGLSVSVKCLQVEDRQMQAAGHDQEEDKEEANKFTVVMKFEGSSVASAERMREVADLILSFPDENPLVVLSAVVGKGDVEVGCGGGFADVSLAGGDDDHAGGGFRRGGDLVVVVVS